MNLQEREQLILFLQQLTQVQLSQKDAEADMLVREACARQQDSGYLLVQRAMQLEHAVQTMKTQISQLQADLEQARSGTQNGFLNNPNAWGRQGPSPAPVAVSAGSATESRAQAPASAPVAPSAWGSGTLGNIAATAAGVAAGSFLFQGIGNLMGHHNQASVNGLDANANPVLPVAENTVINNYYDSKELEANAARCFSCF